MVALICFDAVMPLMIAAGLFPRLPCPGVGEFNDYLSEVTEGSQNGGDENGCCESSKSRL